MDRMATKTKRGPGRPRARTHGVPYVKLRIRPETMKMLRVLGILSGVAWGDLADEAMQVGLGYIYARRRQNLAEPIREIPEITQYLNARDLQSLKGTEFSPL